METEMIMMKKWIPSLAAGAVLTMSAAVCSAAAALSVPVWDFYTVAGGDGASDRWIDANLFSRDRIHLINPGYTLQARLLFDALTPAVE